MVSRTVRAPDASLTALRRALGVAVLLASGLCMACSSSSTPVGSTADAGGESDAMAGGSCASETRADAYAPGLEKVSASGNLHVRLVEAKPAPPEKGDNVWTIAVSDASGAPVTNAALTMTPFMPDHAHGSAVVPVITAAADGGTYTVDKIYLPMAGYWEMTIRAGEESVVFGFCVEG